VIFIWDLSLNIAIGPSAAWHQFAQWLISRGRRGPGNLREIHMEGGAPLVNPSDEQTIQAVVKAYEACWNRHDMAALAELFADDAHWVNIVGMYWPASRLPLPVMSGSIAHCFKRQR
jgi:Domain of unknown function (DUF4440)